MRNFLWDTGFTSKHHWVRWETICKPKDEGGLGIRMPLEARCAALEGSGVRYL
ncbi:hypothetical protein QQ045_025108 [Rhodiola kirilowii]